MIKEYTKIKCEKCLREMFLTPCIELCLDTISKQPHFCLEIYVYFTVTNIIN